MSIASVAENGDYANAQFPVSGERGEGGTDGTETTPGVSKSAKLG